MRKVITVDGLAGTGKSSVAKGLAERLGWIHLNSGLLYRAVAFLALETKTPLNDELQLTKLVLANDPSLQREDKGEPFIRIGERKLGSELFLEEVSASASKVSQFLQVRKALLKAQKEAFITENIIAEGRDMGTVVFPDADLKFFIEVDENVKAERRLKQLSEQNPKESNKLSLEEIKKSLKERDKRDAEREASPTVPAKDAVIIDNTASTLTETITRMYNTASSKGCA